MRKTLTNLVLSGILGIGSVMAPSYSAAQPATPAPTVLQAPPVPQQVKQKHPLPSDADLKKAETDIREVYKAEYQAKDPVKVQEFANKLLDQALQIKNGSDLPTKCILLREAYVLSLQPKSLDTAFKASDALNDSFDTIDVIEMKSNALTTSQKNAKTKEDLESIAGKYSGVIDEALNDNKYKSATEVNKSFKTVAQKLNNTDLVQKAADNEKRIPLLEKEYNTAAKALETLGQNPADPAANLTYGKYLSGKGDWEKAIDYFAKGSDTDLKDVAVQEMSAKTFSNDNPDAYIKLAETWEKIAKKANKVDAERFNGRAVEWYQNALSATTNPVAKAKIEKKLKELEGKTAVQNGLVNLLAMIDPQKDALAGKWERKNGKLYCDDALKGRIEIPYQPPKEYDFKVVFTRTKGSDAVVQILPIPIEGRQAMWVMGVSDRLSYFIKGPQQQTEFKNNKTYTSLIEVREGSMKVYLDNKLITEQTDYKILDLDVGWNLKTNNSLGIGCHYSPTIFDEIQVREVKGKGKRLR